MSSASSESTDLNEETWDDWVEDPAPCMSLFGDVELPSAFDALKHDLETHGFDLNEFTKHLSQNHHCAALSNI
jgi:type I protein arginine methyltransferase